MTWKRKALTPDEAVAPIGSGSKIFLHGACASPIELQEALARRTELDGVEIYNIHTGGPGILCAPEHAGRFISKNLFVGSNQRKAVEEGRSDFIPIFLSDIPWLFQSGRVPLDYALIQVSPPDRHGLCSLGTSVDVARAAVDHARHVIAQINPQMPRTHGHGFVHISVFRSYCIVDRPLIEVPPATPSRTEEQIAEHVGLLIEDGSTLQLGIGSIADCVAACIRDKRDLGIHTEMFSDPVVGLVEAGAIKGNRNGLLVTSFVMGTERLFKFVNDNPAVHFHPADYTNDTSRIRQIDKMVAVNGALEIDLTGQVCADSIGPKIFSGIGGQMDFIRGAALSRGGKPIIALPATAAGGTMSRIVSTLKPGAGVVTTRGHVHWVVTEFGAVNLHGLSLRQRGEALISLAHPDFRPELRKQQAELRHF